MSELFRKKAMDKVQSPEQLNDYIRVTTPSVWLVLIALIILLVGVFAWGIAGTVSVQESDGSVSDVHPIVFVTN